MQFWNDTHSPLKAARIPQGMGIMNTYATAFEYAAMIGDCSSNGSVNIYVTLRRTLSATIGSRLGA